MFGFGEKPAPAAAPVETPSATPGSPVDSNVDSTPAPEGLDRLQQLLDNKPNTGDNKDVDGVTTPDTPFDPVALLNNPEAIQQITDGLDFTSSISADTQQKLQDNSPDAIMSLVQDVTKASYVAALKHGSVLAQQTMEDRLSRLEKSTGERISSSLSDHELNRELPQLSNPLIKMAVEGFQDKLQAQNPTMTPGQVAAETKTYLAELSKSVNPDQHVDPNKDAGDDGTDWLTELGIK